MKTKNTLFRRYLYGSIALAAVSVMGGGVARAAEPIKIGYIPVLGSSALFVLQDEGWAKQAGLDLRLIRFQSGTQAIQALSAGQIDAYVAGVLPLLVARAHGVDVKVFAAGAVDELELVANGPFADTKASDFAARVADFTKAHGRKPKIAAQPVGSVPDTLLRFWLKQSAHVDPDAVDIVGIDIDAAQQALLAGSVDAAVLREPALTVVRHRLPGAVVLQHGGDLMQNQPGSVLAVLHPDAPDRKAWRDTLVSLFNHATALLVSKPDEAAPFVQHYLGDGILSQAVIAEALRSPDTHFTSDLGLIEQPVRVLQDFEVSIGVVKHPQPVDGLFAGGQ